MVDHNAIADKLSELSDEYDYESRGSWVDSTYDGTPSALGAGHARYLLEEMGVIMVKARPVDDSLRMWFADIQHEEVEVTTTEERFTF